MNKSIKFGLIALLWATTLPILGMHDAEIDTSRSTSPVRSPERDEQEARFQQRLNHEHFFHSDDIRNLKNIQITNHDGKSIGSVRRWWDRYVGKKGDLTTVIDAFKRLSSPNKISNTFYRREIEAFSRLSTDDQITLARQYLDKIKTVTTKKIKADQVSSEKITTKIDQEIQKLNVNLENLEEEKNGLEGKKWNIHRFKNIFTNSQNKTARINILTQEIEQDKTEQKNKSLQKAREEKDRKAKETEAINNFDREVKEFLNQINPTLVSKDIKLRFDLKTATFQVHKTNPPLQSTRIPVIKIPENMQRQADQQAQTDAAADRRNQAQTNERERQTEIDRLEREKGVITPTNTDELVPAPLSPEEQINELANTIGQNIINSILDSNNDTNEKLTNSIQENLTSERSTIEQYDNKQKLQLIGSVIDFIKKEQEINPDNPKLQDNRIINIITDLLDKTDSLSNY